jgi:hypothetical protein
MQFSYMGKISHFCAIKSVSTHVFSSLRGLRHLDIILFTASKYYSFNMRIVFVVGCVSLTFGGVQSFSEELPRNNLRHLDLARQDDCQTNPNWQATQSAWITDDTDANAASWWQNVSSRPHSSFTKELGDGFGAHLSVFKCGIGAKSTCVLPACTGISYQSDYLVHSEGFAYAICCLDYQNNLGPAWSYELTHAIVNLNNFFNDLYVSRGSPLL